MRNSIVILCFVFGASIGYAQVVTNDGQGGIIVTGKHIKNAGDGAIIVGGPQKKSENTRNSITRYDQNGKVIETNGTSVTNPSQKSQNTGSNNQIQRKENSSSSFNPKQTTKTYLTRQPNSLKSVNYGGEQLGGGLSGLSDSSLNQQLAGQVSEEQMREMLRQLQEAQKLMQQRNEMLEKLMDE